MRLLVAIALVCAPSVAQAQVSQDIPVKTVYEDMRLICGIENSTDYKVRVMQAASKQRALLKKQGYAVITTRLTGSDAAPIGLKARTRADCAFD